MVKRLEGLLVVPFVLSSIPVSIGFYESMTSEEFSTRIGYIFGGAIAGAGCLLVSYLLKDKVREIKDKFYSPKL